MNNVAGKIINNITNNVAKMPMEDLTLNVLKKANIKYNVCIINDFDLDRVYLEIDNQQYTIRMWNVVEANNEHQYRVHYSLYIDLWNEEKNYGYCEELGFGIWHIYKTSEHYENISIVYV